MSPLYKIGLKEMMKLAGSILLLGFAFSLSASAAPPITPAPVFNHFWYTHASQKPLHPCDDERGRFTYENQFTELNDLVSHLSQQLPSDHHCKWGQPALTTLTEAPPDYPGQMLPAHLAPQPLQLTFNCQQDTHTLNTVSYKLFPSYNCPTGTKYFGKGKNSGGCYRVTDHVCRGDVVGRVLAVKMPIYKELGHVAIALSHFVTKNNNTDTLPMMVAEVMEDERVVQFNTLDDFKSRVKGGYWGAKYGHAKNPVLNETELANISQTIIEQAKLKPQYTKTWHWWPGKILAKYYVYDIETKTWKHKAVIKRGRFRCDSFIYYLFLAGAKQKINYDFLMTPKTLFAAFTTYREKGFSYLEQFHLQNLQTITKYQSHFSKQSDIETEIRKLFSSSDFDNHQVDLATYAYVHNESITRKQKILFLTQLMLEHQHDSERLTYLLDIIDGLKPVEIYQDLIQIYHNHNDSLIRDKILSLLSNACRYQTLDEIKQLDQEQVQDIVAIMTFLKEVR